MKNTALKSTIISFISMGLVLGSCSKHLQETLQPEAEIGVTNDPIIFTAIRKGDENQVSQLLEGGADVDVENENGETPLFFAVLYDH